MDEPIRDTILEVIEASLEAQLNAVRKLRRREPQENKTPRRGKSQVDMVHDVLVEAGAALHLKDILGKVEERFGVKLDPDTLVSALTKYVLKGERFARPARNTFAVLEVKDAG